MWEKIIKHIATSANDAVKMRCFYVRRDDHHRYVRQEEATLLVDFGELGPYLPNVGLRSEGKTFNI